MAQPGDYTYRARRTLQQQPTLLERYGETHIHTMLRAYFPVFNPQTGLVRTNHDFGPLIEAAARTSAKIVSPLHTAIHNHAAYIALTSHRRTSWRRTKAFWTK
jgi:hypothetical protein